MAMKGRAFVMPSAILSMEINDDVGNLIGSTFTVHYVMSDAEVPTNVSEELKDVTAVFAWPTDAASLAAVHKAYRDMVILQQPVGYNLTSADVIVPQFVLGSLA
jgi:hypothetical protein